jgi:hypothetical protein
VTSVVLLFEVWQSPGGLIWEGVDQEEAFLTAIQCRRPGVLIEVAEIQYVSGHVRPRRIACYDDRRAAGTSD